MSTDKILHYDQSALAAVPASAAVKADRPNRQKAFAMTPNHLLMLKMQQLEAVVYD